MLLLSFGVFSLSLALGTDKAAQTRAGGVEAANLQAVENARKLLHLDDPWYQRYWGWLGNAVQLDFGRSLVRVESVDTEHGQDLQGQSVTGSIKQVIPRTASVVGVAIVFALLIGVPVGIIGGIRPGRLLDRISTVFVTIGLAVPSFWIGMLLVSWLAVSEGWLPAVGYVPISEGGVWGWLEHLLMPGLALSLAPAAVIARQMRAALAEVMGQSYIRTAWAKGASLPRVVVHHALRNAAGAPLTVLGLMLVSLLGGTVIIETLFGIDGVGVLVINAVRSSDVPMLQGIVMMFVVLNIVVNLIIDVIYGFLNPKVRIT